MLRAYAPPIRLVALFVGMLAMVLATIALPGVASAQTTSKVVVPVTGKLSDGGTFKGRVINPKVSYNEATDSLRITGILRGTATTADDATHTVNKEFTTGLRVSQAQQNCQILILDIGRIHLDLLGLVVNISPIHIDVHAVPGAGNLLGNLLCAIAGLLDPNAALADFLNGLLARLFTV